LCSRGVVCRIRTSADQARARQRNSHGALRGEKLFLLTSHFPAKPVSPTVAML
jgi:hypothetical protein